MNYQKIVRTCHAHVLLSRHPHQLTCQHGGPTCFLGTIVLDNVFRNWWLRSTQLLCPSQTFCYNIGHWERVWNQHAMLQSITFGRSIGIEGIMASQAGTRHPPVWFFFLHSILYWFKILISIFQFVMSTKTGEKNEGIATAEGWTVYGSNTTNKKGFEIQNGCRSETGHLSKWCPKWRQNGPSCMWKKICGNPKMYSL